MGNILGGDYDGNVDLSGIRKRRLKTSTSEYIKSCYIEMRNRDKSIGRVKSINCKLRLR